MLSPAKAGGNPLQLSDLLNSVQLSKQACADCNALREFAVDACIFSDVLEPYVPKVFDCMREHPNDVNVQKCAVMALASLGEKKGIRLPLVASGRLDELLDMWTRLEKDESLVKDVLVLLRTVSADETSRNLMYESKVIPLTVECMKLFCDRPSIQSNCMSLLTNLSYDSSDAKLLICERGGVQVAFECLRRFQAPVDAKLQAKGCALLRNLSVDFEPGEQLVVSEDGLNFLRDTFRQYRLNSHVAEQSLSALRNLAGSPKCYFKNSAAHSLLLEEVTSYLLFTKTSPGRYCRVHEICISLLNTIASDDAVLQTAIGKSGGLLAVVDVTQSHLNLSHNSKCATVSSIPQRAATFFRRVAFVAENRRIVGSSENGVEVLIGLVRRLKTRALLAEQALLALGNTLFDFEDGKAKVLEYNGICEILSVMRAHPHISGLQDACCLSLRALCDGSRDNSAEAVKLGCAEACMNVMRTYNENVVLQEHALATLIVFVQNDIVGIQRYLGGIQEIARAATISFPRSPALKAQRHLLDDDLGDSGSEGKVVHRMSLSRLTRYRVRHSGGTL